MLELVGTHIKQTNDNLLSQRFTTAKNSTKTTLFETNTKKREEQKNQMCMR